MMYIFFSKQSSTDSEIEYMVWQQRTRMKQVNLMKQTDVLVICKKAFSD